MNAMQIDLVQEAKRIVSSASEQGMVIRVLGGVAVQLHCDAILSPLQREYGDLDLIARRRDASTLDDLFTSLGYTPNKVMNTLHETRKQYFDTHFHRQVDIFVGDFEMCHRIPVTEARLCVEPFTLPLAELFLTKMQIVELNLKDILDVVALLAEHDVAPQDEETLNIDVISRLCGDDWGLYTTLRLNLAKIREILPQIEGLSQPVVDVVSKRIERIQWAIDGAPKTWRWKLRARIGTRVRWYQEVEEVRR